ncbi:MAG: ECF transporter S component [Lachnospiraceae bacterium]|nr:ECF transporter S component [Lachnospiraceae bacterium]
MNTKMIARTGILLAICIVFQLLKGISVYITGPAVNAVIVIAVLSTGLVSGLIISVIAPLVAFLVGATPILQLIPLMLPVIMISNCIIAFAAYFYKKNGNVLSLILGSAAKAAFLWLLVWYVMLPVFGANIPDPAKMAMKTTFSITQLVTALLGCAIALIIWKPLEKALQSR